MTINRCFARGVGCGSFLSGWSVVCLSLFAESFSINPNLGTMACNLGFFQIMISLPFFVAAFARRRSPSGDWLHSLIDGGQEIEVTPMTPEQVQDLEKALFGDGRYFKRTGDGQKSE